MANRLTLVYICQAVLSQCHQKLLWVVKVDWLDIGSWLAGIGNRPLIIIVGIYMHCDRCFRCWRANRCAFHPSQMKESADLIINLIFI